MTLAEFKAWLEGYSTSFAHDKPDLEQWITIKERLSQVRPYEAKFARSRDFRLSPLYAATHDPSAWAVSTPASTLGDQ